MRLWSLHPRHLDARGLVAVWREGLLAQAVLRGLTVGYTAHPQLVRFRLSGAPVACIARYLQAIQQEAAARGYAFDRRRIAPCRRDARRIPVTEGQLAYEWRHLRKKLRVRDRAWLRRLRGVARPEPHPLFALVAGPVEGWETRRAVPRRRRRDG